MIAWIDHDATIDLAGDEFSAVYQVRIDQYRGQKDDLLGCTLTSWSFYGREQTRKTAVELLGREEVARQEDIAARDFWDRTGIAAE